MDILESRARPGVRVEGALGGGPAPLASASLCLRLFLASAFPFISCLGSLHESRRRNLPQLPTPATFCSGCPFDQASTQIDLIKSEFAFSFWASSHHRGLGLKALEDGFFHPALDQKHCGVLELHGGNAISHTLYLVGISASRFVWLSFRCSCSAGQNPLLSPGWGQLQALPCLTRCLPLLLPPSPPTTHHPPPPPTTAVARISDLSFSMGRLRVEP